MGAPVGNQFWKQRHEHGRDALFATADALWAAACEYFEWCDANPWIKVEQLRKPYTERDDAGNVVKVHTIAELPTTRPYTLSGLCLYLNCNEAYFRQKKGEKDLSEDFSTVITRIGEVIWTQKFEGAAVGAFNANIISRDLGLADKKEVKANTTHRVRRDELNGEIVVDLD